MGKYDNSANIGEQMILKFIHERIKEKGFTQTTLAEEVGVNQSTLSRNLNGTSKFTIDTFLKVLGALEIRPFFIPAEVDKTEMQRMFFS